LAALAHTQVSLVCGQAATDSLPANKTLDFSIGGDEKRRHTIALEAGEFFQIRVEQLGVDVSLRLLNATGAEVARMSLPRSYQKEITLTFVAPAAESYQLEVAATDQNAPAGQFTIRREAPRPATALDRRRVAVEHTFAEGMTAREARGPRPPEIAIQKFTQARPQWEELAEPRMAEITKLLIIQQQAKAKFYAARTFLNEKIREPNHEALKQFEESARLYHEGGEFDKEAFALMGAAVAATNLGNFAIALQYTEHALPFFSAPEQQETKSGLLMDVVRFALAIGDDITALKYSLPAFEIYKKLGRERETILTRMTIGALYYRLGDYRRASEFLTDALPSVPTLGEKCLEVEIVVNLAAASLALDRKAEAMRLLRQELPPILARSSECKAHQAAGWNNLGAVYHRLGDYGLAINTYTEALALGGDKSTRATTYLNLGEAYFATGRIAKALNAFKQAAALYGDVSSQTRLDLDVIKSTEGLPQLQQLQTGLTLRQNTGDSSGAARTLNHLSLVYLKLNDKPAALKASQQALSLYAALNDRGGEAIALSNAMKIWQSLGRRRLAIFFGKQSLMRIQDLRRATAGLEISLQQNYARTFKDSYQQLAQLLIEEGLFEQAVQVVNLYRDQDSFDLDRNVSAQELYLSTTETTLARRYDAETNKLRNLAPQISELKRQLGNSPAESSELVKLEGEFKQAGHAFNAVLRDADEMFSQPVVYSDTDRSIKSINDLRVSLRTLGTVPKQRAVSIYTFVTDERFYVLLIKPERVDVFSHPTTSRLISERVKRLLTVLRCPDSDPYLEAAKVYDLVFKSVSLNNRQTTLEAELDGYKPDLLLWSLDDELGSVPMAALYDAGRKQFLVERYQHAITNRFRPELISREPKSWLSGIGFGAAREYSGYGPALPGVKKSLDLIFNDPISGRKGLIDGPALIDDQFRRSEFETLNGRWPLVHVASHFTYHAGDADNSTLLLGDGSKLSLSELEKQPALFKGVEMLVLSACKTSVQQSNAYGKVIEGLATLSQRLGATSVIGALWNVSDLAGSERDVLFYRLYREHQDWPKSEVLRQSQLGLLYGKIALPFGNDRGQGCQTGGRPGRRFNVDLKARLAHPYYWAPFVLYGSSR
jgi:CHAT domain-containing protein